MKNASTKYKIKVGKTTGTMSKQNKQKGIEEWTDCPICLKYNGTRQTARLEFASKVCPHIVGINYRCGCGCIFSITPLPTITKKKK